MPSRKVRTPEICPVPSSRSNALGVRTHTKSCADHPLGTWALINTSWSVNCAENATVCLSRSRMHIYTPLCMRPYAGRDAQVFSRHTPLVFPGPCVYAHTFTSRQRPAGGLYGPACYRSISKRFAHTRAAQACHSGLFSCGRPWGDAVAVFTGWGCRELVLAQLLAHARAWGRGFGAAVFASSFLHEAKQVRCNVCTLD